MFLENILNALPSNPDGLGLPVAVADQLGAGNHPFEAASRVVGCPMLGCQTRIPANKVIYSNGYF